MKRSIRNIVNHNTFKNVGYLTIGNIIGRGLSLVGVFYIPKLLGPEQYGVYNTVTAFVALFAVFTFEGINKVVIRESARDLSKSKEIIESTFGLRLLFSLMATILCASVTMFIDYDSGIKLYMAIYSISLVLSGLRRSLNSIYQSFENMRILAVSSVIRPLLRVPIALALLMNGYGVLSLLIVDLVIDLVTALYLYLFSRKFVIFNVFSKIKVLKKYVIPGARFSVLGFLNTLSCRIDIVMLSLLTTQQNVGVYALAYRIVEAGLMVRQPISQSIFPYYSKKFVTIKPRFLELVKHTLIITVPLIVVIIPSLFVINPVVTIVFGDEFVKSAELFGVLVFYLVFYFALIPWGLFLETTNNELSLIYICTACAVINILLNIVLFDHYGVVGVAYSTLAVELFRLTFSILFSAKVISKLNR